MKPEEFVQQAMSAISNDPYDRVPITVAQMMDHPDTVFETHFHIFDKYCVTRNYFLLRMLGHLDPNSPLEDLLEQLVGSNKDNEFDELFKIMKMGSMIEVLDHYLQNFACQSNIVALPLMMDLDEGWYFKAEKTQKNQVDEIKGIMQNRAILPFLSVDPRKAIKRGNNNLYKLFLNAFSPDENNNKFFGIKVYPALGYLPSDVSLWPIYEVCEAKNIPVVTHCGGSIIRSNENDYDLHGYQIVNNEVVSLKYHLYIPNGSERASFLNHPKHWEVVLKRFPKLKLNLGHFGGIDHWINLEKTGRDESIETINRLMAYENVYADLSYNIVDNKFYNVFFENFDTNITIQNKTMFGSDYWMAISAGDFKQNQAEFIQLCGLRKDKIFRENPMKFLFGK